VVRIVVLIVGQSSPATRLENRPRTMHEGL
jgi:hypothetical protein